MRRLTLVTLPILATFAALPLAAQVSARVHVGIPIGRPGVGAYSVRSRPLLIRDYDPVRFGAWDRYYDRWAPETVYLYDGQYYDYQIDPYATPVVVYSYNDQVFFPPRAREFVEWRDGWRGGIYRGVGARPLPRGDYQYREPVRRDDRAPLRDDRAPRSYSPAAPRGDYGRSAVRPVPQQDHRGAIARGGQAGHDPRSGSGHQGGRPRL